MKKIILTLLFILSSSLAWATFPTTPVLDNFTRANSTTTLGSNWVNDTTLNDPTGIISNTAYDASYNTEGVAYWNVTSFSGNIEAYLTISTFQGVGSDGTYVIFSSGLSSGNFYEVGINNNSHIFISRDDGYTYTNLASFTQTSTSGDSIGATFNTSTGLITAYYKSGAGSWVKVGSFTDTTYIPNYIGFFLGDGTVRISNFGGGNFVSSIDATNIKAFNIRAN